MGRIEPFPFVVLGIVGLGSGADPDVFESRRGLSITAVNQTAVIDSELA